LFWRLGGAALGRAGAGSEPVVATLSSRLHELQPHGGVI
jgi:hypothetical protein